MGGGGGTPSESNVGIGNGALASIYSIGASCNVAIGATAGVNFTTGDKNTIVGYNANISDTTSESTVVGWGAQSSGYLGTAIGSLSGAGNQTVALGPHAGNTVSQASVFIGNSAGSSETGNNKLYIDNSSTTSPLIYGDFSSDELTVNGKLYITDQVYATNNITSHGTMFVLGPDQNDPSAGNQSIYNIARDPNLTIIAGTERVNNMWMQNGTRHYSLVVPAGSTAHITPYYGNGEGLIQIMTAGRTAIRHSKFVFAKDGSNNLLFNEYAVLTSGNTINATVTYADPNNSGFSDIIVTNSETFDLYVQAKTDSMYTYGVPAPAGGGGGGGK